MDCAGCAGLHLFSEVSVVPRGVHVAFKASLLPISTVPALNCRRLDYVMRTTNITGGWFCQYRQSAIHSGRIFMRNVIHDYGQQGMQCCCWSGYILISLITWMFSVLYEPLLGLCIRIRVLNGVADHTITESWQIARPLCTHNYLFLQRQTVGHLQPIANEVIW
jgi:hypothetical protein